MNSQSTQTAHIYNYSDVVTFQFKKNNPVVMGILNVTSDSFYADSRCITESEITTRAEQILTEGGKIIDVGACSTRPGSTPISENEERDRLRFALDIICRDHSHDIISVDTFRPAIARMCVENYGVRIINDVSGGSEEMFREVRSRGKYDNITYILTSTEPIDKTKTTFAIKVKHLNDCGCTNIWLDPGYGFGKDMAQNYEMLRRQEELLTFGLPLIVGVSRKRMVWQLLNTNPIEALNGTTVLNTISLTHGAHILRVHDVKEAVETIKIVTACS